MPSRWSLLLKIADPDAVRPQHLYGLLAGWLEAGRDATAHHALRKPYTLSPLRPVAGRPRDEVAVDIGLLDDELADTLLRAAAAMVTVSGRLGRQGVRCLPWPDGRIGRLAAVAGWDELTATPAVGDRFTVRLLTPTMFRSEALYLPFPLPGLVLGHLREQWSQWGPAPEFPGIDQCRLGVVDYDLDCVHLSLRGRDAVASVGSVTYRVGSRDANHRRAIGQWLAVAPFAGVGADTRMGLGQVEVDLTHGRGSR